MATAHKSYLRRQRHQQRQMFVLSTLPPLTRLLQRPRMLFFLNLPVVVSLVNMLQAHCHFRQTMIFQVQRTHSWGQVP